MSAYSGRKRSATNGPSHGVQRSFASQLKERDALFNTYEHLQGLSRPDTALTMLRKIASLVKPIMRKRGWKVAVLAEFLPPEANLLGLNINHGYKICLRLRYHNHPELFLPLEQIVDTMLHELSHNVWGAHDARFYRLWDDLRAEHDILVSKGFTGEGFLSEGKRLGGGGPVPPQHEMRRLARASAERRRAQNKLTKPFPSGGQRLGGSPLPPGSGAVDIRAIRADQAIRRGTNSISHGSCGAGRADAEQLSNQTTFRTQAEEDDANDRAIAQALYELIEEEEERKLLHGTLAVPPAEGGLAWHPSGGLYDPRTEDIPVPQVSEEEQMKWAMEESLRSPDPPPPVVHPVIPTPPIRRETSRQVIDLDPEYPDPDPVIIDLSEPFDPNASKTPHDHDEKPPQSQKDAQDAWACRVCTLVNPHLHLTCSVCGTAKPPPPPLTGVGSMRNYRSSTKGREPERQPVRTKVEGEKWQCAACGRHTERKWWVCMGCGRVKDSL